MSRLFGSLRQMGYVVKNIDSAMRHWTDVCQIGPWFYVDKLVINNFKYKGQPSDPHLSIALANSGDVQLELIQQRDKSPTLYQDFLNAGNEGLQHFSSWPENYDEIYQTALATGYTVGQEADSPRGRRQTGQVGCDGEDIFEVHGDWVVGFLTKLKCWRR